MRFERFVPLNLILLLWCLLLAACSDQGVLLTPTPTVDPEIYNQVPDTAVFEPGQCSVVLDTPAPAYTSNTLGGQASAEIPAGTYEVRVAADYGSSLWYDLAGAGEVSYVNATSVTATEGACPP